MWDWGIGRKTLYGARLGVGLGLVAGGLEAIGLAASSRLPLGVVGFLGPALVATVGMGAVAGLVGLTVGAPLHSLLRRLQVSRALAVHVGLIAALLCGFYLWQGSARLVDDGRTVAAAAMALMPLGFWGVAYFNAGFWLRRVEVGWEPKIGWLPLSAVFALVLAVGAALGYPSRYTGGGGALSGDLSVLVLTVDGLPREALGAYGGPDTDVDRRLADAVVFDDAVTPSPLPAAAAATVLTGLHPLRHRALSDGDRLGGGYRTLAEVLDDEGYATGAFVSARGVSGASGIVQGFRTVDDALVPGVRGVEQVSLIALGIEALARLDVRPSSLDARPNAATVASYAAWLARHAEVPAFAWVHLRGDDAPLDAVAAALAALDAAGATDSTVVVLAGTSGGSSVGLGDPAVRVPLVIRLVGKSGQYVRQRRVAPQVRLMDVTPTVLDALDLDPLAQAEGVDLGGYAEGVRERTMWTSLVGRDDRGWLIGLRNNGVKYVRVLATGAETLFEVRSDPGEATNLVASQLDTLEAARSLLASERRALEALVGP